MQVGEASLAGVDREQPDFPRRESSTSFEAGKPKAGGDLSSFEGVEFRDDGVRGEVVAEQVNAAYSRAPRRPRECE